MLKTIISTPNLYIALVIGAALGSISGGIGGSIAGAITGFLSGGQLGEQLKVCMDLPTVIWGHPIPAINMNLLLGALIGGTLGGALGAAGTSLFTGFCVYHNKTLPKLLSNKTIHPVITFCATVGSILGLGIFFGALLGVFIHPIIGPAVGACCGFGLVLAITIGWVRKL